MISDTALIASKSLNKQPSLVLQIEGISDIFGTGRISKALRFGDEVVFGQQGIFFGGFISDDRVRDLIDLQKSTSRIQQQLEQDKGSVTSVTNINISLIDPDGEVSEIFAPGKNVNDVLGLRARVYYLFSETSFPEDAVVLLDGIVTDLDYLAGSIKVRISHPMQFLRQEIAPEIEGILDGALDSSTTNISVLGDFLSIRFPGEGFLPFVRVGDEIISYSANEDGDLTFVQRGVLNTVASSHDDESRVESFYAISGNPIDLALKVLLSMPIGVDIPVFTPESFNDAKESGLIENSIFFLNTDINREVGVTTGDRFFITKKGDTLPTEEGEVLAVERNESGSFIIADFNVLTLPDDPEDYDVSFESKYDVFPFGVGLNPAQVEVSEFLRIRDFFSSDFPEMFIYIKSEVNALDFLADEILVPNGLYFIPRNGRISVGRTTPPLALPGVSFLDKNALVRPSQISIRRTVNKNFYNSVVYKYDEDSLENKTLFNIVTLSADSINRIKVPNKPLNIKAGGFRDSIPDTTALIQRQARRFLERYQFAAEELTNVNVSLAAGFSVEVGDTVVFGDPDLNLPDTERGDRFFTPRVMEVTNKSFSLGGEAINLRLLDTAFSALGRFGVISPSSKVGSISNGVINILPVTGDPNILGENSKWLDQVGEKLVIHSEDWSVSEELELLSVSRSNPNQITIENPSISISQGFIIDIAEYGEDRTFNKAIHCFWNPEAVVLSGLNSRSFAVVDSSDLFEQAVVSIVNSDYTNPTIEARIVSIDGNQIEVDRDLDYTPSNGDIVQFIGFVEDEGLPYRLI